MLHLLCFRWQKSWVKGAWVNETLPVVSQLLLLCVCQFLSKLNTFQRKKASEEKSRPTKKNNFTRFSTYSASNQKIWVKGNVGSWDYECSLVNYLHYVSAKIHPNRTTFRVKGLASKKVVKPKWSNFTRCSTYSASNDKTSSQWELKKFKLCMYLINYFHDVCAKNQPRPTFLRVKGLAKQKVVKPKSTNFTRCSTYSTSIQKILSQRGCRKLRLCIYFS